MKCVHGNDDWGLRLSDGSEIEKKGWSYRSLNMNLLETQYLHI